MMLHARHLYVLVSVAFTIGYRSCLGDHMDLWITEMTGARIKILIATVKHEPGRMYYRGFPRAALGTAIFPVLTATDQSPTRGWQLTKGLLNVEYISGVPALLNYHSFVDYLIEYFCTTDDDSWWMCCVNPILDATCGTIPYRAKEVMEFFIEPRQSIGLSFLYRWCTRAWSDYRRMDPLARRPLEKDIYRYCPNPCFGSPCVILKGVANPTECEVVGPFENDFRCICSRMYTWDSKMLACMPISPCMDLQFPPCIMEYTHRCVAVSPTKARCFCYEDHMGEDCSLLRNACIERLNKSAPNGYTNCRVDLGNKCEPVPGTDQYTCECGPSFTSLLTMSEDNCFGEQPVCAIRDTGVTIKEGTLESSSFKWIQPNFWPMTCLNGGECVSSADFSKTGCLCMKTASGRSLFEGVNCERPIGTWSSWTEPTKCLPSNCGKTRYRWRRRRCLNNTDPKSWLGAGALPKGHFYKLTRIPSVRCPGTSEEVLPCESLKHCASLRLPSKMREEIFEYRGLYYFAIITVVEILGSFLCWYVFGPPLVEQWYSRH